MDIVLFGASGNLAEKKVIPALIGLYNKEKLPKDVRVIGYSRSVKHFDTPFEYVHVSGEYHQQKDFDVLKQTLRPGVKHVFYLALPPQVTKEILVSIHGMDLEPLVLIEKPFGENLAQAEVLTQYIHEHFKPNQCLRVDHYAGKKELRALEQDLLDDAEEITIYLHETSQVGERGHYHSVGALKDVGQNHLLFALSTLLKGSRTREEVLESIATELDPAKHSFGAYEDYPHTETFFSVSLRTHISEHKDVTITLVSGKALKEDRAGIVIRYKNKTEREVVFSSGTEAYENIIHDAVTGNLQSFVSDKEVLQSWKIYEEIEKIKQAKPRVVYKKGSSAKDIL